MEKVELKIEDLNCGHCVGAVDDILKNITGVESVNVNLPDSAKVSFNEVEVSIEQLKQSINDSEIYKTL